MGRALTPCSEVSLGRWVIASRVLEHEGKVPPMAERPRVNPVSIVARLARAPAVDDSDAAMAEIALETLNFLDAECREGRVDPGPTAHLVVLDLAAALIAFGAVRNVDELAAWLRREAPARARELGRTVASMKAPIGDAPLCSCLTTPGAASWH
jgi:hypothetical protein